MKRNDPRHGAARRCALPASVQFRSSHHCAAHSFANFGIEGHSRRVLKIATVRQSLADVRFAPGSARNRTLAAGKRQHPCFPRFTGYFRFPIVPAAAANIPPAASLLLPRRIDEAHRRPCPAHLAGGQDRCDPFDDEMPGFGYRLRLGAGGKILRSWICISSWREQPSAAAWAGDGARCRAGADMAKKALGRVANGEDPQATGATAAARTRIRSRPPSPITWRSSSARCVRAPTPSWRAISPARISGRCTASRSIRSPARTLPPVKPDQLG